MTLILVWNIIEAIVALQYPSTYVPPQPKGMELTPTKISSPLVSQNLELYPMAAVLPHISHRHDLTPLAHQRPHRRYLANSIVHPLHP